MLWFILLVLFVGIIIGALARLLMPGPDPIGCLGTWALGIAGSFVGGFLGALLFGFDSEDGLFQLAGFLGSVAGAVIILLVRRLMIRRASTA